MVGMDTTAPDLFSWIRRQTSAQPYQPSKIICLFKELIYTSFHVTWAFPTATCHLDILYSYILECLLHPLIICSSSSWCLHPNLTHVVALVHTRIYSSNFKWTELKPKVAPSPPPLSICENKYSNSPPNQQFIGLYRSSLNWFSNWLRNYFEVNIICACT